VEPLDEDVSAAIQKMHQKQQFFEMLPKIDCGACGAPTCMAFAEDVVKGIAVADDCVFLAMKKFASMSGDLLETVVAHSRKVPHSTEVQKK
ncbi:MAG: (Fe-S)-binding protein, partial [Bacteroidota bacterium]